MVVVVKVNSVGKYTPAGVFKTPDGRDIAYEGRREFVGVQPSGDIVSVKAEAEEKTAFKVGESVNVRVTGFKSFGGIAQIKGFVV